MACRKRLGGVLEKLNQRVEKCLQCGENSSEILNTNRTSNAIAGQTYSRLSELNRPMSQDERNVNDEIHGSILIPPAVHAILDTVPVQRLGSLHQLGCAFYACKCYVFVSISLYFLDPPRLTPLVQTHAVPTRGRSTRSGS